MLGDHNLALDGASYSAGSRGSFSDRTLEGLGGHRGTASLGWYYCLGLTQEGLVDLGRARESRNQLVNNHELDCYWVTSKGEKQERNEEHSLLAFWQRPSKLP